MQACWIWKCFMVHSMNTGAPCNSYCVFIEIGSSMGIRSTYMTVITSCSWFMRAIIFDVANESLSRSCQNAIGNWMAAIRPAANTTMPLIISVPINIVRSQEMLPNSLYNLIKRVVILNLFLLKNVDSEICTRPSPNRMYLHEYLFSVRCVLAAHIFVLAKQEYRVNVNSHHVSCNMLKRWNVKLFLENFDRIITAANFF